MIKGILLVVLLGCSAPVALGQATASLSGYVTDATSGETLLLASVALAGTPQGASTNNAGYYTLTGLAPGAYTVVGTYLSYETFRQEVTLGPGERRRLDIALVPEDLELEEIVVEAEDEEDETGIGLVQMPVETIKQLPTILEPDVFRSLQLLPGVKAASDFSSGLYIRGGDPGQTLILLDRTTVYNPSHVFGFFSTFNPDAIKDVRLYKGGYPAEYGDRLGAVVDIYNKDGNRLDTDGSLSVGLLASRLLVEGPYARGSWMLALRRSTLEPLLRAFRGRDGIPDGFYFYDINGKVNFDASRNDRLSLSVYAGDDNLDLAFLEDARLDLGYGNRTLSANWTHIFSSKLFSFVTLTASRYASTPRLILSGTEVTQESKIFDTSVKADLEYIPNERHAVKGGFWGGRFIFPYTRSFDGRETFNPRIEAEYASAYLQETFRPTPRWSFQGGLRLGYFGDGGFLRLEPRLSVEHQVGIPVRVQAAYGRYHQFKTLITSESFAGFDFWLTSAAGVPPAYGDQFVLGLKVFPRRDVRVNTEVYYRTMRDLFVLDPFLSDPSGLDYADYFTFGDGYAYGWELQVDKTAGRLNGFVGYTYSQTRRRFPDLNVVDGEPRYYPPKYDVRHDLTVVSNYDLGRTWRLTGVFTYATGQAFTQPNAQYKLVDAEPLVGSIDVDVVHSRHLNNARLPAYHRLDLGVSKIGRFFFDLADYELQLQVINAYNRRNIWFYVLEFEDDNTVTRNDIPQIPVPLPNVSLTLTF